MTYEDYGLVPDEEEEYVSIDDIARSEGFYIDDDNHWVPLKEEYDPFW